MLDNKVFNDENNINLIYIGNKLNNWLKIYTKKDNNYLLSYDNIIK